MVKFSLLAKLGKVRVDKMSCRQVRRNLLFPHIAMRRYMALATAKKKPPRSAKKRSGDTDAVTDLLEGQMQVC